MTGIAIEFITGLTVGLEHDSGNEDEDYHWLVAIHLGLIRIMIIKFKLPL